LSIVWLGDLLQFHTMLMFLKGLVLVFEATTGLHQVQKKNTLIGLPRE